MVSGRSERSGAGMSGGGAPDERQRGRGAAAVSEGYGTE